jgi:hypothetical protein
VAKRYLYHGSAAPDILDVLLDGLQAREDRAGISLTTSRARARWWASLKGREVYLLRLIAPGPATLIPEDAYPAEPEFDFTYTAGTISPILLQVYADGHWTSLLDRFGEALSEDELADWQERWSPSLAVSEI